MADKITKKRRRRCDDADAPTATQLRDALRAYVVTCPDPSRLEAHLASTDVAASLAEIRAILDCVIDAVEHWFAALPPDASLDAAREAELAGRLRQAFPWLDAAACENLTGFVRWYAWHEGFLPP